MDFRLRAVRPALDAINLWSTNAEELLIAICAHESLGCSYLIQVGGPALGPYQMEPDTHDDIWAKSLHDGTPLKETILRYCLDGNPFAHQMCWDLQYATMMARVFLLRIPEALPDASDVTAMANYWKKYWNTPLGAGNVSDFINNYHSFVG